MIGMIWRTGRRFFRFMLVVVLGYLCQVCIMPYLAVNSVTPSLLFAVTAIVTVCYGRLRAFWVGGIYGILMEIMLPCHYLLQPAAVSRGWRSSARFPLRIRATSGWNMSAA